MKKRFAFVALQSIAIVAIAAAIAFSPALAARQPVEAETTLTVPTPTVNVTGTGKVIVKPTIARVNFGVFTHNETSAAAQAANDIIMAKITSALKAAGIKEDDIQTSGYSLQPRWIWDKATEKNVQDGYDMNHSMVVTVRAIKDAGKIVSLVADNGANTVDGISFEVDDATLEQMRLTALNLAMVSARKRADVVARAAGKTILSVQTVVVNENSYTPYPMYNKAVDMTAGAGNSPAPVEAGTLDILISVNVTYVF